MLLFDVVKWQNKKLLMHLSANIILINIIAVLVIVLYIESFKNCFYYQTFPVYSVKKIVNYCLTDLVDFPLLKCNVKGKMALFHDFINVLRLIIGKDSFVSNP